MHTYLYYFRLSLSHCPPRDPGFALTRRRSDKATLQQLTKTGTAIVVGHYCFRRRLLVRMRIDCRSVAVCLTCTERLRKGPRSRTSCCAKQRIGLDISQSQYTISARWRQTRINLLSAVVS